MKLIPAPELLGAMRRHRHDFKWHHDNPGERVYLCKVCGKVASVKT